MKILKNIEDVYALGHGTYVIQSLGAYPYIQTLQYYDFNDSDGKPAIGVLDFGDEMGGDAKYMDFPVAVVWSEEQSNELAERAAKGEFDL